MIHRARSHARWSVEQGDALDVLRRLPAESVHTCVTSPPYYGLRDYGVEGQLGHEATPDLFVRKLVKIFSQVRRVLREDGTCWINIADSYAGGGRGGGGTYMAERGDGSWRRQSAVNGWRKPAAGLKPKDLSLIPARLALALQRAGWWVRADIIWRKERPMPESVDDRPTKAHEYIFLLSKAEEYFYDAFAVREPVSGNTPRRRDRLEFKETKNARSVWTMDASPHGADHYATFPEELPTKCILAGTSAKGCCRACGASWVRVVERTRLLDGEPAPVMPAMRSTSKRAPSSAQGISHARVTMEVRDVGWRPGCSCEAEIDPCVVLDPFTGSGTTGVAALKLDRRFVGAELNPEYVEMARRRIGGDSPLLDLAAAQGGMR